MAFPDQAIELDLSRSYTSENYLQRMSWLLSQLSGGGGAPAGLATELKQDDLIAEMQLVVSALNSLISAGVSKNIRVDTQDLVGAGVIPAGKLSISMFVKTGTADWTLAGTSVPYTYSFDASVNDDVDQLTATSYDTNGNTIVLVTTEVI